MTANKTEDLENRLILLEKFLQLKSNECAYYRTKVHLMQIHSDKQSSNEPSSISHGNEEKINSYSTIPLRKTYAHNQNYNDEKKERKSLTKDRHFIEQTIISYLNKHFPQSLAQDKNIQCNDNEICSHENPHTVLMIRLPRRFIKSLVAQQKKSKNSNKLKVHFSSELLTKLFQSIHFNSKDQQFTIQSQFGPISASINRDQTDSTAIHAQAEVKTSHDDRLSILRHRHHHHQQQQQRKRHVHRTSSSTSENPSKTIETNSSSSSHSIWMETNRTQRK